MKKLILLTTALCIATISFAQDGSFQKNYENGKELFRLKRYGLAMQAFKPLTSSFNENPYIRHASFYYAVSAFHENQYDVAAAMLNQVKKTYPEWKQMDEVNLWLSKIYSEKRDFSKAVAAISDIKDAELKSHAYNNLEAELANVKSYDSLHSLYNQFPDNKEVGITLAKVISKQPQAEQDKNLLFALIEKFNLDIEKLELLEISETEKKDAYSVAVMLPFMMEDLTESRGSTLRNQFVIDLYQGVLLGNEELKSMGINLNLYAYDTKSSKEATEKLLSMPELQHVDLIYGPLYPFPVMLANEFSSSYKINMFNPLSSNLQVIGDNPYSFLYMPTYETQGRVCAEYVLKNVKNKDGLVFYGTDERDSILAHSFARVFYEAGDSSLVLRKIEENKSKKIIQILTQEVEIELDPETRTNPTKKDTVLFKIPKDSLGFVFVASESPALASSAISGMEVREDSTILIGKDSWLNSQIISFESLERLKAILIAPSYIDYNSNAYQYFETIYKEKYNTLPSRNASIGYETIILLGKLLNKYGNHFENDFDNESMKGSLFQQYILNRNNSNQYVPLVQFQNLELKLLNP